MSIEYNDKTNRFPHLPDCDHHREEMGVQLELVNSGDEYNEFTCPSCGVTALEIPDLQTGLFKIKEIDLDTDTPDVLPDGTRTDRWPINHTHLMAIVHSVVAEHTASSVADDIVEEVNEHVNGSWEDQLV